MSYRMGAFFPKTPRSIRLGREHEDLKALKKDSTIFDFEAFGDPPERYVITFHGNSLIPTKGNKREVKLGKEQKVELRMGGDYPVRRPDIHWLTPIVHPNISSSVCLGNYGNAWTPYFKLVDLIEILWDYSRMAILNPEGGYRTGVGVEEWEDLRRHFKFPVDLRPLRDKVLPNDAGSSIVRPGGDEFDIVIMPDDEGSCS